MHISPASSHHVEYVCCETLEELTVYWELQNYVWIKWSWIKGRNVSFLSGSAKNILEIWVNLLMKPKGISNKKKIRNGIESFSTRGVINCDAWPSKTLSAYFVLLIWTRKQGTQASCQIIYSACPSSLRTQLFLVSLLKEENCIFSNEFSKVIMIYECSHLYTRPSYTFSGKIYSAYNANLWIFELSWLTDLHRFLMWSYFT